jgi:uncharacterized membrane protein
MYKQILNKIKPLLKPLFVFGLVFMLVFANAGDALAARSGGRIGGGSFRTPRTYSPPGGGYRSPGGGYGFPGGGIGFPFLFPFPFFGVGGGLFSLLIFIAIANFLLRSLRSAGGDSNLGGYSSPKVSVAQVQVGLLSSARELQQELNQIARTADTSTGAGRAMVLQEATLALLRHPEYWVYGASEAQQAGLESAEAKFNQYALAERSKFTEETLSNVNSQLRQAQDKPALSEGSGQLAQQESGEYIVVTLVVGAEGQLKVPEVNSGDDLRQALRQIGGISSDRLLAVEVLWTPQAEGDTLSTDDLLANYPNLRLV